MLSKAALPLDVEFDLQVSTACRKARVRQHVAVQYNTAPRPAHMQLWPFLACKTNVRTCLRPHPVPLFVCYGAGRTAHAAAQPEAVQLVRRGAGCRTGGRLGCRIVRQPGGSESQPCSTKVTTQMLAAESCMDVDRTALILGWSKHAWISTLQALVPTLASHPSPLGRPAPYPLQDIIAREVAMFGAPLGTIGEEEGEEDERRGGACDKSID